MISICSLIYRSKTYADAVWNSAQTFTPELKNGKARFFFVANDPTPDLLDHLKGYPHVVQRNECLSNEQLSELGYDPPEYIRMVYQGWNRAILESDEICVLVNSDCMFSPDWLAPLIRELTPSKVVSSQIVERNHPKYGVFRHALEADFGDHPSRFKQERFLEFVNTQRRDNTYTHGAYMPCAIYRQTAIDAGMYPEGNPQGSYGDQEFFSNLARRGVEHITTMNSIVYHFKEGEMSE